MNPPVATPSAGMAPPPEAGVNCPRPAVMAVVPALLPTSVRSLAVSVKVPAVLR